MSNKITRTVTFEIEPNGDCLAEIKEFKEDQDSWNIKIPVGFMQSSDDCKG